MVRCLDFVLLGLYVLLYGCAGTRPIGKLQAEAMNTPGFSQGGERGKVDTDTAGEFDYPGECRLEARWHRCL